MYFDKDNYHDCNKYFADTFVQFAEAGMDKLFLLIECDPVHIHAKEVVYKDNLITYGESIAVAIDKGYDINFVLPRKAIFQYEKQAMCLYRIPAKQWKKGIHPGNTGTRLLNTIGNWQQTSLNAIHILKYINKPVYLTFQDVKTALEDTKYFSFALSPRLSMSIDGNVFLDMSQVGNYNHKTKTLSCSELVVRNICPYFPDVKLGILK